jgi:hypothetical protein
MALRGHLSEFRVKLDRDYRYRKEMAKMSMNDKQYAIDGNPASAREIIKQAEYYDDDFAKDWCKQTSVASAILKANRHRVGINPEWKEEDK